MRMLIVLEVVSKRIEGFLPKVTRWSHSEGSTQEIDWPLFPGYCFARFDAANRWPVLYVSAMSGDEVRPQTLEPRSPSVRAIGCKGTLHLTSEWNVGIVHSDA